MPNLFSESLSLVTGLRVRSRHTGKAPDAGLTMAPLEGG